MPGRITKHVPCGFKVDGAKQLAISTDSKLIAVSHMTVKTLINTRADSFVYKLFGPTPTEMHLNCVTVWSAETSRILSQFYKDSSSYTFESIKFSPNGKSIAGTYSHVGIVDIWDFASGKLLQTIGSYDFQTSLTSYLFSPTLPEIICAQSDGILRIWDTNYTQTADNLNLSKGFTQSVKISPDLKIIASTSPVLRKDAVLELWDASNGQFLRQSRVSNVLELEVCFSADSKRVASWAELPANWHSDIVIWDCQTLAKLHSVRFTIGLIGFNENLRLLTTCDHKNIMRVFNFNKGEYTHSIPFAEEYIRGATSPDGKYLATVSKHTILRVWDLSGLGKVRLVRSMQLPHHQFSDLEMQFSTNCSLVAVSSYTASNITICDITNGQVSEPVNCPVSDSLCYSAAGGQLLTNTGTLNIDFLSSGAPDNVSQLSSITRISRNGYGLSDYREWIMLGSQKVMYIPLDYQTRISAVLGSTVVLGCRNGKVLTIRFSENLNAFEQCPDVIES